MAAIFTLSFARSETTLSFRLAKSVPAGPVFSQNLPVGEPLDWRENAFPTKWKLSGKLETFNWD